MLRRVLANASWLLTSNVLVLAFAFAQGIVLARAFGPASFGVIALLTTFVLATSQLVDSRSWETTIRFVSRFRAAGDATRARAVVKASLLLDLATSALGFLVILVLAGPAARSLLDDASLAPLLRLLGLSLLLNAPVGTGLALLRLDDRFRRASAHGVLVAALRLAGVGVVLLAGAGIAGVVGALVAADALGLVALGFLVRGSLRRLEQDGFLRAPLASLRADARRIGGFLATTNASALLKLLQRQADVLVVGFLLTPIAAGYYRIARSTADLIAAPAQPLVSAAYPAFAKLDAAGEKARLRALAWRLFALSSLVGIVGWLAMLLLGRQAIVLTAGEAFAPATPLLPWLAAGVALATATAVFHPYLLATARPRASMLATALGVAAQFAVLFVFLPTHGLIVAGMAYLAFYIAWCACTTWAIYAGSRPA